ncbi:transcriptional activator protein DAL81 [Xylogone sp. PMI_703]|nr:transcriptional activator protein DAL81 [Xylogone sp. PMI_703]
MASAQRTQKERPCDACRRRKIRCIRVLSDPALCALCQSRSEPCTFRDPPAKKKRQPSRGNHTHIPLNARSPQNGVLGASLGLDDALCESTLLRNTLGHSITRSTDYIGPTSEYDLSLLQQLRFDQNDEYVNAAGDAIRRVSQNTYVAVRTNTQEETDSHIKYLDIIEGIVAPHGEALIDIYFRIVHPSYPILHKKVFLEKHRRNYRELMPTCLAAVYILALHWWSYSPNLVRFKKPNVQELEALFPRLMADIYRRPKASDLQAGLLFSQRPDGSSWMMMGGLMAMSQICGLHIDSTDWRIPEWEKALRKRLAWAVFIQDKWGALIHGRPSAIAHDNWDVKPVRKSDFPETAEDDDEEDGSTEVEKGMIIYMDLISLTEILSDILDSFFTLKALKQKSTPTEVLEKAKPLQIKLKTWYSQLPPGLVMEETKPRKLSSTGYLHLGYFCAEITLHRAILRSLDNSNANQQLTTIARTAARVSFWFFASKINLAIIGTFGCMLWATSESKEEREFYRQQLAEFRWTLRLSSATAEFMKFTVEMLDASPVFTMDCSKLGSRNLSDRQSSQNDSPKVNDELDRPFTPQEMNSSSASYSTNVDYNNLNIDDYPVEYSAFAFRGVPSVLHGDNLAASMTPPDFYNAG